MNEKITKIVFAITIIFAIAAIVSSLESFTAPKYTGKFIANNDALNDQFEIGAMEIESKELLKCCDFVNSIGEKESCYVLAENNCSYCGQYC